MRLRHRRTQQGEDAAALSSSGRITTTTTSCCQARVSRQQGGRYPAAASQVLEQPSEEQACDASLEEELVEGRRVALGGRGRGLVLEVFRRVKGRPSFGAAREEQHEQHKQQHVSDANPKPDNLYTTLKHEC